MSNNLQRKKKILQGQLENTQEVYFTLNEGQQKGVEKKKIFKYVCFECTFMDFSHIWTKIFEEAEADGRGIQKLSLRSQMKRTFADVGMPSSFIFSI